MSQVSLQDRHKFNKNGHKHTDTTGIGAVVSEHNLQISTDRLLNSSICTDTWYWYQHHRDGAVGLKPLAVCAALKGFMNVPLHLLQVSQSGTDGEEEHFTSVATEMFCHENFFSTFICVVVTATSLLGSLLTSHSNGSGSFTRRRQSWDWNYFFHLCPIVFLMWNGP